MNRQSAIRFLRNNQPLPGDDDLTEQLISEYDEVRRYFLENKDVDCVPLFLNSFGDGSGFGVYQLVERVIVQFNKNEVLPHIVKALGSEHRGVKRWCVEIAASFPDPGLINSLEKLLLDDDSDTRIMACLSLDAVGGDEVIIILKSALKNEKNEDVLEVLEDIL